MGVNVNLVSIHQKLLIPKARGNEISNQSCKVITLLDMAHQIEREELAISATLFTIITKPPIAIPSFPSFHIMFSLSNKFLSLVQFHIEASFQPAIVVIGSR